MASWKGRWASRPVSESRRASSRLCSYRSAFSSASPARPSRWRSRRSASEPSAGCSRTARYPSVPAAVVMASRVQPWSGSAPALAIGARPGSSTALAPASASLTTASATRWATAATSSSAARSTVKACIHRSCAIWVVIRPCRSPFSIDSAIREATALQLLSSECPEGHVAAAEDQHHPCDPSPTISRTQAACRARRDRATPAAGRRSPGRRTRPGPGRQAEGAGRERARRAGRRAHAPVARDRHRVVGAEHQHAMSAEEQLHHLDRPRAPRPRRGRPRCRAPRRSGSGASRGRASATCSARWPPAARAARRLRLQSRSIALGGHQRQRRATLELWMPIEPATRPNSPKV